MLSYRCYPLLTQGVIVRYKKCSIAPFNNYKASEGMEHDIIKLA
jgi:hypothetical protein